MARCASACVRKAMPLMSVPFARNLAAADIPPRRGPVFAGRSLKSKKKSWRKLVTSLNPTPDGVLLVDKAEGMTSHDVVALVRRRLGIKKVGHCGTLDPIATGLLLLTLGRGTKIQDLLMSEDKEYVGTFVLGVTTSTYVHDIGEVLGCGAHLKSLRRTKSGRFDVAQAISVDHIKNASREEILSRLLTLPEVSRMRGA